MPVLNWNRNSVLSHGTSSWYVIVKIYLGIARRAGKTQDHEAVCDLDKGTMGNTAFGTDLKL